ncbi:MAG TPA: hypothetical protein VGF54_02775 [Streptosporangiaceae bacterium]
MAGAENLASGPFGRDQRACRGECTVSLAGRGLVDWSTGERARQSGLSLRKALVTHEATAVLEACGDAMVTGPGPTNANDLVLIPIR